MISSSPQNHSCRWPRNVIFILLLYLLYTAGVGGAKFTFVNRCSEPIWPIVFENATQQRAEYAVSIGSSVVVQRPSYWSGRVWAKTGCTFDDYYDNASCVTGDKAPYTLGSADFYAVSLVYGYNLPLVITPVGGTGFNCGSAGCVRDLNQVCPTELQTQGGAACLSPCEAFRTPRYCCRGAYASSDLCLPTNYSKVFEKMCPTAYSYAYDDDPATYFACTDSPEYFITFCPPYDSSLDSAPPPAASFGYPPYTVKNNNQQRKQGNKRSKEIITIVSTVSISGLLIIAITISCFLKRRHFKNVPNRHNKRDVENLLFQHGSLAPKRYKYSEIKKMTKSLSDKLGQGGFGSVYRGRLPDGRLVAVKILNEIDSNGEEFINEVASISRTSHVNIVSLLGFCFEGNKSALVYEYMPKKSLDMFLSNNGSSDSSCIDNKKVYEIAVGIARGLEYLHTGCITRIVHFDIKPQNILLDDDLCPKISDFGLAKLCKKKQSAMSVSGTRGTAGYIAPEVFSRNFGAVSHKSDVYSYGMMLLEMAGTRKNVGIEMLSSENYFPDKIYEQVIIDVSSLVNDSMMNEEGEEEEEEIRRRKMKMMLIGFWCIQTNPSERPSMSKVVEMLELGSIESIQIPPKPFLTSTIVIPHHQQTSSSSFLANGDTDNSVVD